MRAQGSELRVQSSGFRVQGSGCRVQGAGFRVQGSRFRVQGSGSRVQGSGVGFSSPWFTNRGAPLHDDVQWFRGGLVHKASRLLYHSTLGLRGIKKKS